MLPVCIPRCKPLSVHLFSYAFHCKRWTCFCQSQHLVACSLAHALPTVELASWNASSFHQFIPLDLLIPTSSLDFFLQLLVYFLLVEKNFSKVLTKVAISVSSPFFSFLSPFQLVFAPHPPPRPIPPKLWYIKSTTTYIFLRLSYWTSHEHLAQVTTSLYMNNSLSWYPVSSLATSFLIILFCFQLVSEIHHFHIRSPAGNSLLLSLSRILSYMSFKSHLK